jgi:hypothetical protein
MTENRSDPVPAPRRRSIFGQAPNPIEIEGTGRAAVRGMTSPCRFRVGSPAPDANATGPATPNPVPG